MKKLQPRLCTILGLRLVLIGLSMACVPIFEGLQSMKNFDSPQLLTIEQGADNTLVLTFDRAFQASMDDFIPHGGYSISGFNVEEEILKLKISEADEIGKEYFIEGKVYDSDKNSLWFLLPFYGLNTNPAKLVINEFINENSSSRYEKVELFVLEPGNLGGISVYNGSAGEYKSRIVFEDQEVREGEYLIVHFRREDGDTSETGEINEYGDTDDVLNLASSRNSIADVRDFWADGSQGLSDTNGAISIYDSPAQDAKLIDAIVYSNRDYDPEADYGSFGTAFVYRVMEKIYADGGWVSEGDFLRPEDTLRTADSTSTRSINRDASSSDTNSRDDWHIVPTGKSSFGLVNSEEQF